jgi:hypothetical protein
MVAHAGIGRTGPSARSAPARVPSAILATLDESNEPAFRALPQRAFLGAADFHPHEAPLTVRGVEILGFHGQSINPPKPLRPR